MVLRFEVLIIMPLITIAKAVWERTSSRDSYANHWRGV
jgi:hypothetical protein